MKRLISLNGGHVTLGAYVRAWQRLITADPNQEWRDFGVFPMTSHDILKEISFGVHDRINRHLPWFNRGRKWDWSYQTETMRAAIALNTPRLAIHWLPVWLRERFSHRLTT